MNENAQLALDTILQKHVTGIPTGIVHFLEHSVIERLAGAEAGSYVKDHENVYIAMLRNIGVSMADQYLADNPLTMGDHGFEGGGHTATTGCTVTLDGIAIDSPEAVVRHMEEFESPRIESALAAFDEEKFMRQIIEYETKMQKIYGDGILKTGHGMISFPTLQYSQYGYVNYFMAYALYPEVFEDFFRLQADLAVVRNSALCKAMKGANLPLYHRLDHDMADSRGTLVSIGSLERLWVPEFARSIRPTVEAGYKLLWHCDGNLMKLIPFLLESGVNGFQGFQYEDGMDYIAICKMKSKTGDDLVINAGVSVTRELPFGTPDKIREQLRFLVENGPDTGLFLGTSSSCLPGTPWENIRTLVEGLQYYRAHGR